MATTIAISDELKAKLDKLKVHERQPYSEVIEDLYHQVHENED